jgi:hypothetical protein
VFGLVFEQENNIQINNKQIQLNLNFGSINIFSNLKASLPQHSFDY